MLNSKGEQPTSPGCERHDHHFWHLMQESFQKAKLFLVWPFSNSLQWCCEYFSVPSCLLSFIGSLSANLVLDDTNCVFLSVLCTFNSFFNFSFLGSFKSPPNLDYSLNVTKYVFSHVPSNSCPYHDSFLWNNPATLFLSLLLSFLSTCHFPATVFCFPHLCQLSFPYSFLRHSSPVILALNCNSVEAFLLC